MTREYTIDAAGKTLGRVASETAKALMGKTSADYTPNIFSNVKVSVIHISKLSMRDKKRVQKTYVTYTGHPGGLKRERYASLVARRGSAEPLRRAVLRMLPRNTFRIARMKNLRINE